MRTAALGALAGGTGVLPSVFAAAPRAMAAGTFVATDPDLHLLRRATYGPTTASLRSIERMGPGAWLEQQLDPSSIRDSFVDDLLASRYPNLSLSVGKAYSTLNGSWDLMFDLGQAAIVRAAWSERQLLEVMVDFWSNHLNVTNPSDNVWWSRHDYDRRVIRKHALGKFSHMLKASATHPAMMTYLNNAESTKDNPNENYGRELLELHSLGVDGGYDEEDMRQSTLVMTGFGISWDTGEFEYDKDNHYVGSGERRQLVLPQRVGRSRLRRGARLREPPRAPSFDRRADRVEAVRAIRERRPAPGARRQAGPDLPAPRHRHL